ncbi:MAG TPA: helix-turn-helix transcriptional regulator [Polyangiaceae bacterium]|nr:helix-turn-helix transcriptional regulator [Polyangiaceae bacterium]
MAKKWSDIRRKRFSETERAEQDRRIDAELVEMSLAELRRELGVTQAEMASAIEITQSQLSKMERRDDHLVSTLRRAVRALGGEIEVTAVVGSKRVKLSV